MLPLAADLSPLCARPEANATSASPLVETCVWAFETECTKLERESGSLTSELKYYVR